MFADHEKKLSNHATGMALSVGRSVHHFGPDWNSLWQQLLGDCHEALYSYPWCQEEEA